MPAARLSARNVRAELAEEEVEHASAHAQAGAPFKVKAKRYSVDVSPGEMERIEFIAQNLSSSNKIMQAVPSVAPGRAAKYLHKVSCFCFNQQPLTSKGSADLPLLFYLDETLPNDIHEVTLSYTIYDITADVEGKVATASLLPWLGGPAPSYKIETKPNGAE